MLRAASIGLGWWSDELAAAIQGKSGKIRIASCYSRSPDKRAAFAEKFSTRQHDSFDAVLADGDIDAVVLTTPHSLHADHVCQAAAAGKHVFVEKPFALTAPSAREAADACARAQVTLAVGHNRRFSAAAKDLNALLTGGDLGTLLHIETNFSAPSALNWSDSHWRASRAESPGGGLTGLGIHMIDLVIWLGGNVTTTAAFATRRALNIDLDDTTSALFRLDSGATAYLGTMCAAPFTVTCNLYGTEANAFAAIDAGEVVVHPAGAEKYQRPLDPVDTLLSELEEFADACAGNARFRVTPDEAVHSVAVLQAIVSSAANQGAPQRVQKC